MVDPDIRLEGGEFNMFPVSDVYFFVAGEDKVRSQTGWGPWPDLDP